MEGLVEAALKTPSPQYWLPVTLMAALAHILVASLLRPKGKFSKVKEHLEVASGYLHSAAEEDKINMKVLHTSSTGVCRYATGRRESHIR